jgi:hypothetical protein
MPNGTMPPRGSDADRTAIVRLPTKEQTKISPGGAKWVGGRDNTPNEVSYGKAHNRCRH